MKKLNLGCGNDIKKDYVNLDGVKLNGVDIVHDLNKFPYPFKDNEFDYVEANHVLEHLEDIPKVLRELWRICKKNAIIEIRAPHFASYSAWTDLTHKHPFGCFTFDFIAANKVHKHTAFMKEHLSHEYGNMRFNVKRKLIFGKVHQAMGVSFFANRFPLVYETFCAYIFPPKEIHFELEVVKI